MLTLSDFAQQLRNEVRIDAGASENEAFTKEAFVRRYLDMLAEAGEIADAEVSCYARPGFRIDAYAADENEDTLDLFVAIHTDQPRPVKIEKADVDAAFRQLSSFFMKATAGLHLRMAETDQGFQPAQIISRQTTGSEGFTRVRLFLITDGIVSTKRLPAPPDLGDTTASLHVWDIERLFRWYTSGQDREEILIDLLASNLPPIDCLEVAIPGAEYVSYLAVVPAETLVLIYAKYGPRLLERNVRSFLQVRGDINKGIRSTILNHPDRFFAYNNGLTATASKVDVERRQDGTLIISRIFDLQIVNGGQTTASLYRAVRKDKADVSSLAVQMKLNCVRVPEHLDDLVVNISKFANSQNKVSVSDLSANEPFHQRMEELSRTIWAPAHAGEQRETKWFYERARAQYADELARANTPAQKSKIEGEFPRAQLFGKTDLAKYEMSWSQRPHFVSRGAQKCFAAYNDEVAKRGRSYRPEATFFQTSVAKKILFDHLDSLVRARGYSYKAQIVAYAMAWISHATAKRFDFQGIWNEQRVPASLEKFLCLVVDGVQPIVSQPPNGKNVTDWYKGEACWKAVSELEILLPTKLRQALDNLEVPVDLGLEGSTPPEDEEIAWAMTIPAEVWYGISKWAKRTDSLAGWQRGIAYSLGKLAAAGNAPSRRQAAQARVLYEEAVRLGFAHETEVV